MLLQLVSDIALKKKSSKSASHPNSGNINRHTDVHISGEETAGQISLRAKRLGLITGGVYIMCETDVEVCLENLFAMDNLPFLVIVDSIQTMMDSTSTTTGVSGSVGQIRAATARLVQFAKSEGVCILLIGHVTKSGEVAGPRILEHMVDTVLYLEGL